MPKAPFETEPPRGERSVVSRVAFLHPRAHRSEIRMMNDALAFQNARLRAMTADEKFRVAHGLWIQARDTLLSGVRARNPEYSSAQAAERVRELMRDARASPH